MTAGSTATSMTAGSALRRLLSDQEHADDDDDNKKLARAEALEAFVFELADGWLPTEADALLLLSKAKTLLARLPTLVELSVPAQASLHIVGDLHGQYCELMTVLSLCGMPRAGSNMLLFNGDFVDRGPRSVEVMLALLAMLISQPSAVALNRGNHEFPAMSRHYGFEEETHRKYSADVFKGFQEVFERLPLATVVNGSVFVAHGGLFRNDRVRLSDIARIDRMRDADLRSTLAQDLLWSDPINDDGCFDSPRGAGVLFGPDVSEAFCKENGLLCCIRSHEVKSRGFEWQRGGRCLTIFSAANYVGRVENLGAVCHIFPTAQKIEATDLSISTFEGAAEDVPKDLLPKDRSGRVQVTFPSAALRSRDSARRTPKSRL